VKRTVYIETSVISYLAARDSRDPVVYGRQILTHEWWTLRRKEFQLFISDVVLREIRAGDVEAAQRRLEYTTGVPALSLTDESAQLAEILVTEGPIPASYFEDALHIALCAINNADYLLTWNCTHLANAALRYDLEAVIDQKGYTCPTICTPEELMEPWT
jgi:hypothetical protein